MDALKVVDLCKHYPGFDLKDVSFSVKRSRITGFIGRNGAGKSTTLKCLEGAVHPDSGSIAYFGMPFAGNESTSKKRVGFELGAADFYRSKRLSTIADVTKRFYHDWNESAYRDYCQLFALEQSKRVKELSDGMRVKFTLALALSHGPELLVLDEPTSGLDPASRDEILDIFLDMSREKGIGILFSTHITSDLEKCADDILYLQNGRLVGDGPLEAFKDRYAVMPAEEAKRQDVPILGIRKTSLGESALVPSSCGKGSKATLDDIMTHLPPSPSAPVAKGASGRNEPSGNPAIGADE